MSKKILSLVLAIVMVFSTFAIASIAGTSESVPAGKIGIRLETNAEVGMAPNTPVWVKLYYDAPVGETVYLQFSNITIGWNSAAFKPEKSTTIKLNNDITFSSEYAEFCNTGSAHTTANGKKALKDADKTAYGWDNAVTFAITPQSGAAVNTGTGIPIADYSSEVLTMNFLTQKTLEASDIIGFTTAGYDSQQFRIQTFDRATLGSTTVALANLVVTNAVPAAAAKAQVYELSAPRKHATGDKYTVAAFFAFDAATIAPDFVKGTSQFINGITATVTATSGGQSITVTPDEIKYVYDINKDGTVYGFRVIMKNVPADAEITIVPAVATTDNATYTVDTLNFNVADVTAY